MHTNNLLRLGALAISVALAATLAFAGSAWLALAQLQQGPLNLNVPVLAQSRTTSCGEAALVNEEGCRKCYACGYSEC